MMDITGRVCGIAALIIAVPIFLAGGAPAHAVSVEGPPQTPPLGYTVTATDGQLLPFAPPEPWMKSSRIFAVPLGKPLDDAAWGAPGVYAVIYSADRRSVDIRLSRPGGFDLGFKRKSAPLPRAPAMLMVLIVLTAALGIYAMVPALRPFSSSSGRPRR